MLCHSVRVGLLILETSANISLGEESLEPIYRPIVAISGSRRLLLGLPEPKSPQRCHVRLPIDFRRRMVRSTVVSFLRATLSSSGLER